MFKFTKKKILFILFVIIVILTIIIIVINNGKNKFGSLSSNITADIYNNNLTPFKIVSLLYLLASGKAVLGDWVRRNKDNSAPHNKKYDIYQMTFNTNDPYLPIGDIYLDVSDKLYNLDQVFCILVKNDSVSSIKLDETKWMTRTRLDSCNNVAFGGPADVYNKYFDVQVYNPGSNTYITYNSNKYYPIGSTISHNNNGAFGNNGTISTGVNNGKQRPFVAINSIYLKEMDDKLSNHVDMIINNGGGTCQIQYLKLAYNSPFYTFMPFFQNDHYGTIYNPSELVCDFIPLSLVKACCSNNNIEGGLIKKIQSAGIIDICPTPFKSTNIKTTDTCITVMNNICTEEPDINSKDCYSYCLQPDTNCDINLDTFCRKGIDETLVSQLTADSTLDDINTAYPMAANYPELCKCFMPVEYYKAKRATKKYSQQVENILNSTTDGGPDCTDFECKNTAGSVNVLHFSKKKSGSCPNVNQQICENIRGSITINGKISESDLNFAQSIDCKQITNADVSDQPDNEQPQPDNEQPQPQNSNPLANLPTTIKVAALVASIGILIAIIMYVLRTLKLAKNVAAVV
jgi:hypothetical protein